MASTFTAIRLKRKACEEPAEGLLVTLKKLKHEPSQENSQIIFKFATTVKSEHESLEKRFKLETLQIREKYFKSRNSRSLASIPSLKEKLKEEHIATNKENRMNLVNSRRLIYSDHFLLEDDDKDSVESETQRLFQIYDVVEDDKDKSIKTEIQPKSSNITCNGEPLIVEKASDYVYDVYLTENEIDKSFVDNLINIQPCALIDDITCSEESEEECYDDEDDSNDESNWRNDYPDEENDFKDIYDIEDDDYSNDDYNNDYYDDDDLHNCDSEELCSRMGKFYLSHDSNED